MKKLLSALLIILALVGSASATDYFLYNDDSDFNSTYLNNFFGYDYRRQAENDTDLMTPFVDEDPDNDGQLSTYYMNGSCVFSTFVDGSQSQQKVCSNPPSGLISYWTLDESSATHGDDVWDSIGGNNGTLETDNDGEDKSVSGKVFNAYDFDGTDDRINTVDDPLDLTAPLTISSWVNIDAFGGETVDEVNLVGKYDGDGGYIFRYSGAKGGLNFWFGGDPHTYSYTPDIGVWEHWAVTWDGSDIRYYINGSEVGSISTSDTIAASNNVLQIGDRGDTSDIPIDGSIDDVRIYDRVLGGDEVKAIYNATKPVEGYEPMLGAEESDVLPIVSFESDTTSAGIHYNQTHIFANVTASDNNQVQNTTIYLENSTWSESHTDSTSPTQYDYNFTGLAKGSYTLKAWAYDDDGQKSDNISRSIYLGEYVELVSPPNGSTRTGEVSFEYIPDIDASKSTLYVNWSNFDSINKNTIASLPKAETVELVDVTDNGKKDLFAISSYDYNDPQDGKAVWYEQYSYDNWSSEHVIHNSLNEPEGMIVEDFDEDGNYEVVLMVQRAGDIMICSQDTSDPTGSWSCSTLDGSAPGAQAGLIDDVDGDGDKDFFYTYEGGSVGGSDEPSEGGVYWMEYLGGDVLNTSNWEKHEIRQVPGAWWIAQDLVDMDEDGDTDLVISVRENRNTAASGEVFWVERPSSNYDSTWNHYQIYDGNDYCPLHVEVGEFCGNRSGKDVISQAYDRGTGVYYYCYNDSWAEHTITSSDTWFQAVGFQLDADSRDELLLNRKDPDQMEVWDYDLSSNSYEQRAITDLSKADDVITPLNVTGDDTPELFFGSDADDIVGWFNVTTSKSFTGIKDNQTPINKGETNNITYDIVNEFSENIWLDWNIKVVGDEYQGFSSENYWLFIGAIVKCNYTYGSGNWIIDSVIECNEDVKVDTGSSLYIKDGGRIYGSATITTDKRLLWSGGKCDVNKMVYR